MTWYADSAIQLQNMVAQVSTRLQNGGWTLYDNVAGAPVLSSVNNQGVTQYLQVTQVGSYTYLGLQGWKSWNASTHVGTAGSGVFRVYFGAAARGATEVADLYMSVNNNRVIMHIYNMNTNYRTWAYFGGLGTMAGTNDPNCVFLLTAFDSSNSLAYGAILQPISNSGNNWTTCTCLTAGWAIFSTGGALNLGTAQGVAADGNKPFGFPIYVLDAGTPYQMRGDMDGFLLCPLGNGSQNSWGAGGLLGHLDTMVISGVTYQIIQPGGSPSASTMPLVGNQGWGAMGLAIAEV